MYSLDYYLRTIRHRYLTFQKSDRIVYSSSVAFLAIPNLVDISQTFILLSIGLSLSSVVMGFNAKLEEKLLVLQGEIIQNPKYIDPPSFNLGDYSFHPISIL